AAELAVALRDRLHAPTSDTVGGTPPLALPSAPLFKSSSKDDPDYQRLWEALGHDPTGMDQLVERTRLTAANLSSMLLVMELENRVAVEHGRYTRKSGGDKSLGR
ncbi:MAG: hypothetical protein WKF61_07835, partial [Luteimonas sp.]